MRLPHPRSALALLLGAACGGRSLGGWEEVARVPGPRGLMDAVVVEQNGGATTDFGYYVFVVPRGAPAGRDPGAAVAYLYGAVRNGRGAYGVTPRWLAVDSLAVEYHGARRVELTDRRVRAADGDRTLRVVPRAGVADPAAPPGGMGYNLARRPAGHP